MTVSLHLFDTLPLWVSFLFYGFCMGAVWNWWNGTSRGCLFAIIFLYVFAVAIVFWWLSLSVQPKSIWIAFFFGACVPFARRIWEHETTQDILYFFGQVWFFCVDIAEHFGVWNRARRAQGASSHEEPPRQNTHRPHEGASRAGRGNATDEAEAMRREQARREAEARARREEQARKTEPPPRQEASRSHEEVLGLKRPWTQDDLRTAYKREAGRTHPDKWIGKPEAIRKAMEEEYKAIQEAYRLLRE